MVICKALVNTSWKTDDLPKAYDLHIISLDSSKTSCHLLGCGKEICSTNVTYVRVRSSINILYDTLNGTHDNRNIY